MRLYFDTRRGYLVTAPGSASQLTGFPLKSGDTASIEIEFGQSSDPTGSAAIIESGTWTKQQLDPGTVITIGLKEDGDFTDGTLLAGTSSFTYSNYLYTFPLSLNTTAINTAMSRDDADDTNDEATLSCEFEVTYQPGGSGGWLSSIYPIEVTLYHDVLLGDESSPDNASDPNNYLLKQDAIRWYPDITSKTGGTASDLDGITTASESVGLRVQFKDDDASPSLLRDYILETGTDAESSPSIIRPDDYDGTTNTKIWRKCEPPASAVVVVVLEDVKAYNAFGGGFTNGEFRTRDLNTVQKGASYVTLSSNEFTLDSGDWLIQASAPAYFVGRHVAEIYDVTNTTSLATGTAEYSSEAAGSPGTRSFASTYVTLDGSTALSIRHQCQTTNATNGFGINIGISGVDSIYTQVVCTKLG